MQRRSALIVCLISGVVMFLAYYINTPLAATVNRVVPDWWQIVFAFTLIVGVVSFLKNNLVAIGRGEDVGFRIVSLIGLVSMPVFALVWGIGAKTPFMWMFENVQAPMQATVFALLAFFVASASFRGFRARSLPAAILLVSAVIILLSRSVIGTTVIEWLPDTADWIRRYPSMSARRAILIGIGLGSLTTSLRVILGIERTWLGGDKT